MKPRGRRFAPLALVCVALLLAGCGGDDADDGTANNEPVAAGGEPVPAAVAPADAAEHAILFGDWARSAEQCTRGARLSVSATRLVNTEDPRVTCDILSSERDDAGVTIAGTCAPIPGVYTNITFAIAADVVNGVAPTDIVMIQGGNDNNGQPFTAPVALVRCSPTP